MKEKKYKLQRAVIHTAGKYSEEELKEYDPEQQEVVKAYMEAWDGVHVTVSNFLEGEYSVVGWPPDEEKRAKEAIYQMEQDPTFGTYVNDREQFEKDWAAGEWEPSGSIVFPPEMVEILGELVKLDG